MTGWLVLRRRERLWGVPRGGFRELKPGRPPRIELSGGATLVADELLNAAVRLEPRPFPRCARRYYGEPVSGLAVWGEEPVILLDPGGEAPACLRAEPGPHASQDSENQVHDDETR